MPTVAELTDELRRLGGSGYSGKKKAELEVMLADLKKFLAARKAPAPAPAAEAPKPKAAEAAPAPLSAHAESMAKKAKPAKTGAVSTPLSALSAGPAKKSAAKLRSEYEKEIEELKKEIRSHDIKIREYEAKKSDAEGRLHEIEMYIKGRGKEEEVEEHETGTEKYIKDKQGLIASLFEEADEKIDKFVKYGVRKSKTKKDESSSKKIRSLYDDVRSTNIDYILRTVLKDAEPPPYTSPLGQSIPASVRSRTALYHKIRDDVEHLLVPKYKDLIESYGNNYKVANEFRERVW